MPVNRRQFVFLGSLLVGFTWLGKAFKGLPVWGGDGYTAPVSASEKAAIASLQLNEPIFRFIAVADTGMGNRGQYAVAQAMTRYCQLHPFDLAILAGDNIYTNGEIEKVAKVFEKPYQKLLSAGVKFQACLGNHDIRTENGDRQVKYSNFNMPDRYYTFRRDSIQFFALDTNRQANWDAQLSWLESELRRSDATWKIVFGHHPLYSSGMHGGSARLRLALAPLFQKYGVHLYINGHDHNYERTQAIKGTTYLTCGAGADTRMVGRSEVTARSASKLSFAAIEVFPAHILISGIDTDNHIFDQGVILLDKT